MSSRLCPPTYISFLAAAPGKIITPNNFTRWLGVVFDRQLSVAHVRAAVTRSNRLAGFARRICGVYYDMKPHLRQTLQACALSSLFYGAETWFPATRQNRGLVQKVQAAMNRAALPV